MAEQSISGSTVHIKTDSRFAGFLADDFGITEATIMKALGGEPQREAIAICEWATEKTDDPAKALVNWAKKHRRGAFRKARRNMTPAEQRAELDKRAG